MTLETKRLVLREMVPEDFDALYKVLADPEIMQYYPYTFDEARVRGWIDKNIRRYRVLGFGLWAVCLKDSGEMIGDCGLTMQMIDGFICPEIGYHIRRDMQRKGYAGEAAAAVRDWAFAHTPFVTLFSYMKKANLPSSATAKSIGMHYVREYRDEDGALTAVYAIEKGWEEPAGLHFRQAGEEDAEAVLAMYQAVKGKGYCDWDEYYPGAAEIRSDLDAQDLFVLEEDGEIIGAISIAPQNDMAGLDCWTTDEKSAEFARVVIRSDRQGRHLAKVLVAHVLEEMRARGIENVHISVARTNIPAQKTYRSLGFETVGQNEMWGHQFYLCERKL